MPGLRSDAEWKWWGERDPLFAVATWPGRQHGGPTPWTPEAFRALGEADAADIFRHWDQFGRRSGRCVEIGCGAGRITGPLARAFDSVLALDVSAGQIAMARQMLGDATLNVTFELVEQPLIPAPAESCAGMFSAHVFQHLPDLPAVTSYLRETFRVLGPGGTACFHLPVSGAHLTSHDSMIFLAFRNAYRRLKRALGGRRLMEYHRYRTPLILRVLRDIGFMRAEVRIFPMRSNGDYHSFFFAAKPVRE